MNKFLVTFSLATALVLGINSGAQAASNTYTVKSGDTLSRIAKTYHVSVNQLKQWNNLKTDLIIPKQHLKVAKAPARATMKKQSIKTMTVSASAYTFSCQRCSGTTALGINLRKHPNQKVISVDPRVIKLGTKVYVEGYGYAIAADTGGAIKGKTIDVFYSSYNKCIKWGRKTVKIQILN